MIVLSFLLDADAYSTHFDFQKECMHRLLLSKPSEHNPYLLRELNILPEGESIEDVCSYRSTFCIDEIVNSIVWESLDAHRQVIVDSDWMPAGLDSIHLISFKFENSILTANFPRNLRYFFLGKSTCKHNCPLLGFDFTRLPSHMEEVHIIECYMIGILDFRSLPSTMRRITAANVFAEKMMMHESLLATSLEAINVSSSASTFRIIPKAKKLDKRVWAGYARTITLERYETEYYKQCRVKLDAILAEVNQPSEEFISLKLKLKRNQ